MGCQCAKRAESEQQNEITSQANSQTKAKANPQPVEEVSQKVQENDYQVEKEEPRINQAPLVNEQAPQEPVKEEEPKELPQDEYSLKLYEWINKLRQDPSYIIPQIREGMNNITKDKSKKNPGEEKLIYKTKVKVALTKGKEAFEEAISILEKKPGMPPLEFKSAMCLNLPTTDEEFKSKEFFKKSENELKEKGINIDNAWKDLVKEPETSFLLMVVDDTGKKAGMKREDLLNPNYKYIGITSTMVGKSFVAYFSFSK